MEKHSNDSSPASPEFLGSGWFDPIEAAIQGCSTLSIEFPVEERIGSGESGSISILTEC